MINLHTLLANPHTTGSALAFAVLKGGASIATAWYPEHKEQIRQTADVLEGIAVLYLGAAAGDALQSQRQSAVLQEKVKVSMESHDTSILKADTANPPIATPPKTS